MYNPFKRDGIPVEFHSLVLSDIVGFLSNPIQESIYFEFKRNLDESVRGKMANIVSSFANEQGGWIFIGVNDGDHDVVGVEQEDFEQIIGNIIKAKTSPIPYYQVRYFPIEQSTRVLLLIAVPDGVDAPYIVDGTAYRRIGSNTIGLQRVKDRHDFDTLIEKSRARRSAFKKFCRPQVSVFEREWVPNRIAAGGFHRFYGIMSFYFLLPDVQPDQNLWLESPETQQRINTLLNSTVRPENADNEISFSMPFPRFSFARNSLVFRNNTGEGSNTQTIIWQISRNGWCRVHFPLPHLGRTDLEELGVYEQLSQHEFHVLDGQQTLKGIFSIINMLNFLRRELFPSQRRYILSIKVKNVRNNVVFIKGSPAFRRFFDSSPLPLVETSSFRTNPDLIIDDEPIDWTGSFLVLQGLAMSLNLPPQESIQMFLEAINPSPQ